MQFDLEKYCVGTQPLTGKAPPSTPKESPFGTPRGKFPGELLRRVPTGATLTFSDGKGVATR